MLATLLFAQQAMRTTVPIDCPKFVWTEAGVPYDEPGGPPQRHLVLSNGPEQLGEWCFGDGTGRANLYWGSIPFDGKTLRLRVYIDHLIDPAGKLDNVDIRFCMGLREGKGVAVRMVRRVSTLAYTQPDQPRQYIDPGQKLAYAHLGQRWQSVLARPVLVPDENASGDITDLRMSLSRSPEHRHYGNLVGEIDLVADRPVPGRRLVVRTVATVGGADPGTMSQEASVDSGAGERGWWPKADVYIRSDPKQPVPIAAGTGKPYAGYFHLIGPQALEWAQFNRLDANGKRVTNNPDDRFGTKNSGLWGVNILYRVYVKGGDSPSAAGTGIACWMKGVAAAHATSGPFTPAETPWSRYTAGRLQVATPGYVNRRAPDDYDMVDLGRAATATAVPGYYKLFVANAGASVLPSALIVRQ